MEALASRLSRPECNVLTLTHSSMRGAEIEVSSRDPTLSGSSILRFTFDPICLVFENALNHFSGIAGEHLRALRLRCKDADPLINLITGRGGARQYASIESVDFEGRLHILSRIIASHRLPSLQAVSVSAVQLDELSELETLARALQERHKLKRFTLQGTGTLFDNRVKQRLYNATQNVADERVLPSLRSL